MIKILIFLILLSLPIFLIFLNLTYNNVEGRILFSIFVIIIMVERIWETFFTSKDKAARKFRGDWTLIATSFSYFLVSLVIMFGFFNTERKNYFIVILGLVLFFVSFLFRWWSMRILKNEWAIHLNDLQKKEAILVKTGPYKYIRHPIYLSAMTDLIGLSLIANFYIGIMIVFIINMPLFIWRSIYEEKQNLKKFNKDEYNLYQKSTSFMIPWKILIRKKR